MGSWGSIARITWKAARYLLLIVLSSIVGAQLGGMAGSAIGAMTGEAGWVAHGRCAGWTLFVLVAAIGAPFGFVYFCSDKVPKRRQVQRRPPPDESELEGERTEGQKTVGGIKAILVAPSIGAFMGLICGGMLGGLLVAFYFFVALSPLGPGGWWPILPLAFQSSDGGFSTKDPFILIPWLVIVGTFVLLGVLLGIFGSISVGQTRYQAFRSNTGQRCSPNKTLNPTGNRPAS